TMRGRIRTGGIVAAFAGTLALPTGAQGAGIGPDRAFETPIAHASAKAHKAVSAPRLHAGLARIFRRVGRSGAMVLDPDTDTVLFARKARQPRILASNTKLFTPPPALARFEADGRLQTSAWSVDDVSDGISQGLYLRGGGDPTLRTAGLAGLADRGRAAGGGRGEGPRRLG